MAGSCQLLMPWPPPSMVMISQFDPAALMASQKGGVLLEIHLVVFVAMDAEELRHSLLDP